MAAASVKKLKELVAKLRLERQKSLDAIAEIDATFATLGIGQPAKRKRGRPKGSRNKPKA